MSETTPALQFALDEQGFVVRAKSWSVSLKLNALAMVLGFFIGLGTKSAAPAPAAPAVEVTDGR